MIQFIEELSMNAWPSLETMVYDGWLIRISKGLTMRANSVSPLYSSSYDIDDKVYKCEEIYHSKNLPVLFKLTQSAYPTNIDNILNKKGYVDIEATSVQVLDLNKINSPQLTDIRVYDSPEDDWMTLYGNFNNINHNQVNILSTLLNNISPEKHFITLFVHDEPVACGLAVIERGFVGLYDVIVDKHFRGNGYGEQLMLNLLLLGKSKGAQYSYLQVLRKNIPALRLYSKLGFKEKYSYWYRAKL